MQSGVRLAPGKPVAQTQSFTQIIVLSSTHGHI